MDYLKRAQERTIETNQAICDGVSDIIANVRRNGDAAVLEYNLKFDNCNRTNLLVSKEEIAEAYRIVTDCDIADMKAAASNIAAFASAQRKTVADLPSFSPSPGVTLGHRVIPVQACCCYVPGGSYPLYSTALMLGIPAKIAGVPRIAACAPPQKGTDRIHPKTLVALDIAGVNEIYTVGGAHAIAAFSYGTSSIQPVDLIVGPGNGYVTEAKRQCFGQVGIDFIAGPSEVLVIADHTAIPELIAADLLAQCEHDALAQSIVVTTDAALGHKVIAEVEVQLKALTTESIAAASWNTYGEVVVVDSLKEAAAYANARAPEHLEIQVEDSDALSDMLYNFGSLFIGQHTAEVFGDYASGTNHTLPTLGAARYTGGVWVGSFLKTCTFQTYTKAAMQDIAPLVSRMAEGELLEAHARAARIRLDKFGSDG